MSIISRLRLLWYRVAGVPIVVIWNPDDRPEWNATIPGTDLRGAGWTVEAAVGHLIEHNQRELGFRIQVDCPPSWEIKLRRKNHEETSTRSG
jgi:hypothetical protein